MEKKINPIYPNSQFKSFCYIKSVITRPNIIAGDYSYYDDSDDGPESFEKHVPPKLITVLWKRSL